MKFSRFVRFLFNGSRPRIVLMIATGLIAGLSSVGLLAIINRLLSHTEAVPRTLAAAFIGLVILKVLANWLSQLLLVKFAQETILDIGIRLCRKILHAPLRTLERHGTPQLLTTLTDDTGALAWSLQCLPGLAINLATLAGCSLYLAWLSWPAFVAVLVLAATGLIGYRELYRRFVRSNQAVRESRTALFGHFRALTEGIKELMLHRPRREDFLSTELERTAHRLRDHNFAATKQYLSVEAWTQGLFYTLIGVTLLSFPDLFAISGEALRGYVFAMLYMVAPMWALIGAIPTLSRGQVALANLDGLGLELDGVQEKAVLDSTASPVKGGRHRIDMQGAMFQYGDGNGDRHFALGPLDATLATGEVVFVIGGNGSGKSTFVKMLSGLYPPQAGMIRLNGIPVSADNQEWFRQHFSVIFSDFFLFKRLLGIEPAVAQRSADESLRTLQMDQKVRIEDHAFSTVELSQGQRKRLALVTALLEDRPFCVFDEWAADQDPQYKQIFYGQLLQDLRKRGKGVVVVTHDDRYFHLGDRVLKLDEGRLVECTNSFVPGGHLESASRGRSLPGSLEAG